MKRIITLLAATLIGFSQMIADPTAQTIPGSLDLSKGVYTGTGSYNADNEAMDGFKNGGTGTFILSNATAQEYTISFEATTKRDDVNVEFKIVNGETEVCMKEAKVANTGAWNAWQTFKCYLPELPVSDNLTLVITMKSSGSNWTANVKNVTISVKTAQDKEDDQNQGQGGEGEQVVNQIPTDANHPFVLTGAEITGTGEVKKDVENGAFDNFRSNATAKVLVDCVTAGNYKVAFTAGSKFGATLRFSFVKDGETEAELEKDVTVEAQGGWSDFDMEAELGQLSVGKKTLTIAFIPVEGQSSTTNMKNVVFSLSDATGIENVTYETTTNNLYFDLQGRQIENPKKGIYIVNQKKIVVK